MSSKLNDNVNAGRQIRERSEARTRLGNDIERKDLYYHMMNTADPKTGAHFTPKELWVESMLLITAGTTTPSPFFLLPQCATNSNLTPWTI